jgi:ATP-dependent 26S proteasome regulatory subunit
MSRFIENLSYNYLNVSKMALFNYFKTGNPIYDTIISSIFITLFTIGLNYANENRHLFFIRIEDIINLFFKKNIVIIEGKICFVASPYGQPSVHTSIYSDRFKALWEYIINNIENNPTIYKIKETHSDIQSSASTDENRYKSSDLYIVYQQKSFLLDKHIYVCSTILNENDENENKNNKIVKTDKITIEIYSYKYSVSYLKEYIDNITKKYLASIKTSRENIKFIYFLDKVKYEEDNKLSCWREEIFETTRSFNNIFFDGKSKLIEKVNFFINNRNWYYEKGIPYSLGIGLYGPPGTGKTSFIKALANYTDRHIIMFSLKLIKTKRQLDNFFFENKYSSLNSKGSISFDKKIVVFEDIDCVGDIILERTNQMQKQQKQLTESSQNKIEDALTKITDVKDEFKQFITCKPIEDDPITLDDILSLWDGILETPGRIIIISSNHYDKLDSALIRPGRIDITHKFDNASYNTISEMYFHLFGNNIDANKLTQIKEYFYSPAEIINIYMSNKNEEDFIARILLNKKVLAKIE